MTRRVPKPTDIAALEAEVARSCRYYARTFWCGATWRILPRDLVTAHQVTECLVAFSAIPDEALPLADRARKHRWIELAFDRLAGFGRQAEARR